VADADRAHRLPARGQAKYLCQHIQERTGGFTEFLLLHGAIDSIQCSWVKLGDEGCREVPR